MNRMYSYIVPCFLVALMTCSPASRQNGRYKIALVAARSGQHGIFTMNSDTTGGRLLTPDASAQLRASSWSPDGRKIVFFATRREDSEMLTAYRTPYHYPLYLMDAAGGTEKRLLDFPVSSFAWSPDSQKLLYVSAYEDPQHNDPEVLKRTKAPMSAIYFLNLNTGEQKRLTDFGQNCSGSWSPDGSHLALSFGNEQNSDIYSVNLDRGQTRRLTDTQSINIMPAWAPNGKAIVYITVSSQGGQNQAAGVYVVDADGTHKRQISDMIAYGAAWSSDGRSLLFQSAGSVFLVDVDSGKTKSLMPVFSHPMDAVFTPDGRNVMFRSDHEGAWQLYTVDLNGANIKRVSGNLSASMFCLSPLVSKR